MLVSGKFNTRGGIHSLVEAEYERPKRKARSKK
jgi:hypothetical protein